MSESPIKKIKINKESKIPIEIEAQASKSLLEEINQFNVSESIVEIETDPIVTEEVRQFNMHPELLFSVIKAQAGTPEKALLEAVMNAVDAGATQCIIDVGISGYTIEDNGKGFSSRKEIEDFFETFGTPHKEGDATYGKFRMGRGQLFAFSRTVWNSNEFSMDVCIKTRGLDYLLKEKQEHFNGCKIVGTWHNDGFTPNEILTLIREFKLLVKYMQIPIILNGNNISCLANEQKWDIETEEAYIKISKYVGTGVLSVYNLGALVCSYPASKFGIGGIVVAKTQLKVNFARNDVLVSECKIWKKITITLNKLMGLAVSKKNVLTDAERIALVNNIIGGNGYISQYLNKGLLVDVADKKPTLNGLFKMNRIAFSSGEYKQRMAEEQVHNKELAFVLDRGMLDRFMVKTPEEFIVKINELIDINNNYYVSIKSKMRKEEGLSLLKNFMPAILPIDDLVETLNNSFDLKKDNELSVKEKIVLAAMKDISKNIAQLVTTHLFRVSYNKGDVDAYKKSPKIVPRQMFIGVSQVAEAWTDGASYIALSDKFMDNIEPNKLVYLLIHEYCHNESTNQTHSHSLEFFNMYHDIILNQSSSVGMFINFLAKKLMNELTKAGIKNDLHYGIKAVEYFLPEKIELKLN